MRTIKIIGSLRTATLSARVRHAFLALHGGRARRLTTDLSALQQAMASCEADKSAE